VTLTFTESGMLTVAPLVPLLPLAGTVLVGIFGPRALRGRSHWPVTLGIAGALAASVGIFGTVWTMPEANMAERFNATYLLYSWIAPSAGVSFDVSFRIDPLTAIMLVTVCTISLLVAIYSRDYMRVTPHEAPEQHEPGPTGAEPTPGQPDRLEAGPTKHRRDAGATPSGPTHRRDAGATHGGGTLAPGHIKPVPEHGYERYFAFIGLFVFSMCTLVLAGNFLLLYLGWEAVGLCSYLLIGFYYERPAAAAAAKKAFLVNRIGDFGFGLGILFIYLWISPLVAPGQNPLDYGVVFEHVRELDTWQCNTIALLLFCGAVGKSAQIPLYVWLPDAMEGPSPVSALIHAATMVTAGVYMVVRCGPIFTRSPWALAVVAAIGAVTALYAATIAVAQYDMKRILAYSTISQLGYMFLGVGVFAADSAIFHLFTHAFFKALLFLGAGSVMHAMGGVIDLRKFSGLRRVLPVTFVTFVVGALALAGFPFLSGFFSKDEIIHAAWELHPALGLIALVTALLTAFYTFRMVFLAFFGPQRTPEGSHPHESGGWMLVPLVLLAIGAIGAGYVGVHPQAGGFANFIEPHGVFHRFLAPSVEPYREQAELMNAGRARAGRAGSSRPLPETGSASLWNRHLAGPTDRLEAGPTNSAGPTHSVRPEHGTPHGSPPAEHAEPTAATMMYVSSLIAVAGIAFAWFLYVRRRDLAERIRMDWPTAFAVLHNKYYVDEMNDAVVVEPLRRTGVGFFGIDQFLIDGLLSLITAVPRFMGFLLRPVQNGAIQSYGVTMAVGMIAIVIIAWLAH
jgi:NADH:ubiquinone oxidoreductase subunit 5 (subunit L)/multisubunit Na+/H+ antiporter MnhA subunit